MTADKNKPLPIPLKIGLINGIIDVKAPLVSPLSQLEALIITALEKVPVY